MKTFTCTISNQIKLR